MHLINKIELRTIGVTVNLWFNSVKHIERGFVKDLDSYEKKLSEEQDATLEVLASVGDSPILGRLASARIDDTTKYYTYCIDSGSFILNRAYIQGLLETGLLEYLGKMSKLEDAIYNRNRKIDFKKVEDKQVRAAIGGIHAFDRDEENSKKVGCCSSGRCDEKPFSKLAEAISRYYPSNKPYFEKAVEIYESSWLSTKI